MLDYHGGVERSLWYVITGGPYAGKTTLIEALRERGLAVEEEAARAYIDEELGKGRTIEGLREDEAAFQYAILERKLYRHAALPQGRTTFFDRGIPDTIAYLRAHDVPVSGEVHEAMGKFTYEKAFVLDLVGHAVDYARTESPEMATRLNEELLGAYRELGIPVLRVPVMEPAERVAFVLGNL